MDVPQDERQDADGTAHLAYFDVATQLSFVWNGDTLSMIDVCHGGYGEPVIRRIPAPALYEQTETDDEDVTQPRSFGDVRAEFEGICQEHARRSAEVPPHLQALANALMVDARAMVGRLEALVVRIDEAMGR